MLSAKKARQRSLIVSGGDRILSDIEKLWIFTIVKMRCGMFEIKYQPSVLWGPIRSRGGEDVLKVESKPLLPTPTAILLNNATTGGETTLVVEDAVE